MRSHLFIEAMDAYDDGHPDVALQLMEKCANQGDPVACFTVALWYKSGEGSPVNLERSAYWLARLEDLAERGNPEAQWELGQHYRFANLFPMNIDRANFWLEEAANAGCGSAQHHLAWYLETGQYNYAVDPSNAALWYQRAFEQEHPETLYMFAVREFWGGKPTANAIRLLRRAAEKGFKQAADVLAAYIH